MTQKTANEMRISYLSSDVCSSDLGQKTQPPRYFLIGFHLAAQVQAEAVLVQLFVRFHVPQAAAVGADLVGQQDAGELAVPGPAELQLEIDQPDADPGEKARKEVVDPNRQVREVVQFLDRKSTRLNSSHYCAPRMPSSA